MARRKKEPPKTMFTFGKPLNELWTGKKVKVGNETLQLKFPKEGLKLDPSAVKAVMSAIPTVVDVKETVKDKDGDWVGYGNKICEGILILGGAREDDPGAKVYFLCSRSASREIGKELSIEALSDRELVSSDKAFKGEMTEKGKLKFEKIIDEETFNEDAKSN